MPRYFTNEKQISLRLKVIYLRQVLHSSIFTITGLFIFSLVFLSEFRRISILPLLRQTVRFRRVRWPQFTSLMYLMQLTFIINLKYFIK